MGQEVSNQIGPDEPPQTLRERSLEAVAELVTSGKAKRIVVLTGAGISTAAGIPDFRSPGAGLYANLRRLNLPYAEAIFSIDYFRQNPEPFYVLAKELYPGQFHPTVSHAFIALLARKGLLRMLFTQNIDCLERAAGVPADLIVEAHGSFATQRCIECHTPYPDDDMRAHVARASVPTCPNPECVGLETRGKPGLVKPDIVFFGESLPSRFYDMRNVPADDADLVLVIGTSLTVYPFASLPQLAPAHVPRVLFNREPVGDLGTRADDVLALGICDDGITKFAHALGWADELDALWRGLVGDAEAAKQRGQGAVLAAQAVNHDDDSSSDDDAAFAEKDYDDLSDDGKPDSAVPGPADADADADADDEPPEIGGALSSAEIEVNEIAKEIEAVLKIGDKADSKPVSESVSEPASESVPEPAPAGTAPPVSTDKDKRPTEKPQL